MVTSIPLSGGRQPTGSFESGLKRTGRLTPTAQRVTREPASIRTRKLFQIWSESANQFLTDCRTVHANSEIGLPKGSVCIGRPVWSM